MKMLIIFLAVFVTSTQNAKNIHSLGCISAYDAGYEIANWKAQGMERLEAVNKIKDIVADSNTEVSLEQFNFLIQSVNDVYDSKEKDAHKLAYQTQINCEKTEL